MNEVFPLECASEAYELMMSGKALRNLQLQVIVIVSEVKRKAEVIRAMIHIDGYSIGSVLDGRYLQHVNLGPLLCSVMYIINKKGRIAWVWSDL
jgi:hypothetical protein